MGVAVGCEIVGGVGKSADSWGGDLDEAQAAEIPLTGWRRNKGKEKPYFVHLNYAKIMTSG